MKIVIPERHDAPSAHLFVDLLLKNDHAQNTPLWIFPGGPGANSKHYSSYQCLLNSTDLIVHDPRGCGRSSRCHPSTYSLNHYIDDVEALRKALKIDKIAILGKSYGGLCALGYAIRYPLAVSKLILVASASSYHFITGAGKRLSQLGTKRQIEASLKLWHGQFISEEEVSNYFQLMSPLYSITSCATENMIPFNHEVLNFGFSTHFQKANFTEQLSEIQCPTLILVGNREWICSIQDSQQLANKIANSKLLVFDAGHLLEVDVEDIYYSAIRNFLES